jgi:hypothetical protein
MCDVVQGPEIIGSRHYLNSDDRDISGPDPPAPAECEPQRDR